MPRNGHGARGRPPRPDRNATHNLRVKLGIKGINQPRIVVGGAISNVVNVVKVAIR